MQSRYYDPEVGRFLNADSFASTGQGLLGYNMFAYCRSNPVNRMDALGTDDICATSNEDDNDPLNDAGYFRGGGGGAGGNSGYSNSGTNGNYQVGGNSGVGGAITPSNPLNNITYTPKVMADMQLNDFHGFPQIVDNYGALGETFTIRGNDGRPYNKLRISGEYKRHRGFFEYIWDSKGICNHRCFEKCD